MMEKRKQAEKEQADKVKEEKATEKEAKEKEEKEKAVEADQKEEKEWIERRRVSKAERMWMQNAEQEVRRAMQWVEEERGREAAERCMMYGVDERGQMYVAK